jgi:arylsulfatase A-like enzyme
MLTRLASLQLFRMPRASRSVADASATALPVHLLLGWVLAGLLNIGFDVVSGSSAAAHRSVLGSHAVDLGRHVAFGLLSALLVWAVRRWLSRWPLLPWAAFLALGIGLGALVLPTDLDGLAERSAETSRLSADWWMAAIVAGIGSAAPAIAWLTRRRAHRPGRAWLALALGHALLASAIAAVAFWLNVSTSPGSNPSAHLYLSWITAIAAGHALPRLELRLPPASPLLAAAAAGILGLWGSWALFATHSNTVMIQLARRPSSLHLAALFHTEGGLDTVQAALAARAGPYFENRAAHGPAKPTPHARPAAPIVIFFSIDSLRADVLTDARHSKSMPNALDLMHQGVSFANARAPGSMTKYTLSSISTGRYFSQQYWARTGQSHWPKQDTSVHVAEVLSREGVFTAAFPAMRWLQNSHGVMRGFEQNEMQGEAMPGRQQHWINGQSLTEQLVATLEREAARPGFYWVHYLDSHDPFYAGGKRGKKFSRYLRSLGVIDGYLGEVRAAIQRLGLGERTLLFLMSDHGEAFGEHDSYFHGGSLYDELLRVPLLAEGPGLVPREVGATVSLVDLGPTVLDWFGVPAPASFMGESLVPFLLGGSRTFNRPVVAETRLKQSMLFDDGRKVIRDLRRQTLELYDLGQDPGELSNLSDDIDPDQEEHVLLLRSFFQIHTYRENGYRVPYVK